MPEIQVSMHLTEYISILIYTFGSCMILPNSLLIPMLFSFGSFLNEDRSSKLAFIAPLWATHMEGRLLGGIKKIDSHAAGNLNAREKLDDFIFFLFKILKTHCQITRWSKKMKPKMWGGRGEAGERKRFRTVSSVQSLSRCVRPHGLQHARTPCPSPTPRVYSNSCPLSR